jgi:integrase
MTLEMRKGSKWWYARLWINGHRRLIALRVKIEGARPSSLRETGDHSFELSRQRASFAAKQLEGELKLPGAEERLLLRVAQLHVGAETEPLPISRLATEWEQRPRPRSISSRYAQFARAAFGRFLKYTEKRNARCVLVRHVTPSIAAGFMASEQNRGVSPKTFNDVLILFRGAFEHLRERAQLSRNPFDGIPKRESDTIHRQAYTEAEIVRILTAAREHTFILPIVVTAVCTAMRRGDCCMLSWRDVDLDRAQIRLNTHKTREGVEIPIFPLLMQVLRQRSEESSRLPSGFVFPEQATMYQTNPDGISLRFKHVLRDAGFSDDDGPRTLTKERKLGLRRASVLDFHALRATWVTMAMVAGIPVALIQRVTGHRVVDVVMKSYFRPDHAQFRSVLERRLPSALTGCATVCTEEPLTREWLVHRLKGMREDNWIAMRDKLVTGLCEPRGNEVAAVLINHPL